MSIRMMEAAELLSVNKFTVDEDYAHILLNKEICAQCGDKPCLVVCPAALYTLDHNNQIVFDYAGCLECGTCRTMCRDGGITRWEYPRGSYGVIFRRG